MGYGILLKGGKWGKVADWLADSVLCTILEASGCRHGSRLCGL